MAFHTGAISSSVRGRRPAHIQIAGDGRLRGRIGPGPARATNGRRGPIGRLVLLALGIVAVLLVAVVLAAAWDSTDAPAPPGSASSQARPGTIVYHPTPAATR